MRLREKVQTPRRFDEEDYSRRRSNINPCAAVPHPGLMRKQTIPFNPDLPLAAFPSLPLKGSAPQHTAEMLHEVDETMQDASNTDLTHFSCQPPVQASEAAVEVEEDYDSSDGGASEVGSFTLDSDEVITWASLELSVQYRIFVNLCQYETPRGAAIRLRISELEFLNIRQAIARRLQIPDYVNVLWEKLHNVDDASMGYPEPSTVSRYSGLLLEAGSYELAFPISIQKGLKFLDDRHLDQSLLGYWNVNDDGFAQALPDLSNILRRMPIQPVHDSGYSSENEGGTDAGVVVVNTNTSLAGTQLDMVEQQKQKHPVIQTGTDGSPNTVFSPRHHKKQQQPQQLDALSVNEADIAMPNMISPSRSRSTSISSGVSMSPTIHFDDQPTMTGVPVDAPEIERPSASEERSAGSMRLRGSSSLKSTDKMNEFAASQAFWAQEKTTSESDHAEESSQEGRAVSPSLTVVLKYDPAKLILASIERDSPVHGPVLEERGIDGMWRPVSTVARSVADILKAGNETIQEDSSTGFMTPVTRVDQDKSRASTTVPVKPEPDRVMTFLSEDVDMTDAPADSSAFDDFPARAPQNFAMKLVDASIGVAQTRTPDVSRLGVFGSNVAHSTEMKYEIVKGRDTSKPDGEVGDTSSSPASSPLRHKGQPMVPQHQPLGKMLVAGTGCARRPLLGTSTIWKAPPSRRNSAPALAKQLDHGFSMPSPNTSPISSPQEMREEVVPQSAPPTAASFAPGVQVHSTSSAPVTERQTRSFSRNLRSNRSSIVILKIGSPRNADGTQVSSMPNPVDNLMTQGTGSNAMESEAATRAAYREGEPNTNTTNTSTDKVANDTASLSESPTKAPNLKLTMRKTRCSTAPTVNTMTPSSTGAPDTSPATTAAQPPDPTFPPSHRLPSAPPIASPPKTRARSRRVQSETPDGETPDGAPKHADQVLSSSPAQPSLLKTTLSKRAQNVTLTAGRNDTVADVSGAKKKETASGRKPGDRPTKRGKYSTVKTRAAEAAEKKIKD